LSQNHNVTVADYDAALLRLIDLAENDNVIAAAIVAGGTGYAVGDILAVGVGAGTVVSALDATLEVISVAAGVIDGIRVFSCGAYSVQPTDPVTVTGGTGGDDATFNLTFETQNWVVERNVPNSTSGLNFNSVQGGGAAQVLEREVILRGPGSAGADEIYIGILQVRDTGSNSFNWHIAGMTGFNTLLAYEDQPGFSYTSPQEIASFVPLSSGSIECWFHVHPRYLIGVCRISTTYQNFFAGFLNQYATPTDFPYPLYISGCSSKWDEIFSTGNSLQSGLCDPGANVNVGGNDRGPAGLRTFDGSWQSFKNWTRDSNSRDQHNDRCVYPCGSWDTNAQSFPIEDEIFSAGGGGGASLWSQVIPRSGLPGTVASNLFPTEDTGGDLTNLFETVLIQGPSVGSAQIYGEIPDVLWGQTIGNSIQTEDRVVIGGIYYRAFQNCNRTEPFGFVFLREDN